MKLYTDSEGIPYKDFYEKDTTYKGQFSELGQKFYQGYADIIRRYTSVPSLILDAGCGFGGVIEQLDKNRKIIGIDWSQRFLEEAKRRIANGKFIRADLCNLPVSDNSIDFVGSYNVIEHVYSAEKFLKEVKRILNKNGKLLIITHNNDSPLMPLLVFYYSKKYKFKKGHAMYMSLPELLISEIRQVIKFARVCLSRKFTFKYRKFNPDLLEYIHDDAICDTSYFMIRYLKNNGFKIVKNMAHPVTSIKYAFAKMFPYIFTTTYIIAEKV